MAYIGTLGKIVFESSVEKVQTFKDMTRQGSSRIAKHEIISQKPKLEFIGPDLEEIPFTMQLKSFYGVDVKETLEVLRQMRDTGEVMSLIIDGQPVGENKWIVTSLTETNIKTDGTGKIISVDVSVSLLEYVEDNFANATNAATEEGDANDGV